MSQISLSVSVIPTIQRHWTIIAVYGHFNAWLQCISVYMSGGALNLSVFLSVQPVEGQHDEEASRAPGYAAGKEHIDVLPSGINQNSCKKKKKKSE